MKCNSFAILFVLLLAGSIAAAPARAQVAQGAPISVRAKTVKPPKVKIDTFKGQVLHMDVNSIMVRDSKNTAIIRTFTFSPKVAKKLQKLLSRGGYQYGDRVTIKYAAGTTVANSISGRASKPL